MATEPIQLLAFNRGVISKLGLARMDLKRFAMSAEIQTNYMPRVLGSMMLRPGLEFIARTNVDTGTSARQLPFTFGVDDVATIEVSNLDMRVRIDDVLITRPSVSAAVTNGNFLSDISGWVDASDAGGTVAWQTGGFAILKGNGTDFGILQQTVTVTETGTEHALIIDIENAPVRFKVGSTAGDDDYIAETRLGKGLHNLAFTPTGDFTIEFANERKYNVWVDSVNVSGAIPMSFLTPWTESELSSLRWDQSGDVIYVSSGSIRTMKIERRGSGRSWSLVNYFPEDGPFRVQNVSGVTLAASALSGDITLTASKPLFKVSHVTSNSLFRIASQGQTVTKAISGADDFTDPIRVVGSDSARIFGVIVEGTFVATVTLQFAFSADGPWNDQGATYTVPTSTNIDDGQDGQIIYYRIGVKAGDYTSGTVTVTLNYTGGSIQGIARIYARTSSTVVSAHVLKDFGAITASKDWWEGEWSDFREWPTSVSLHEGRLWLAGRDKIFGSVSDSFESFDDNVVGDAGPISRSIGSGPIRVIHWLMSMGRLLFGTSENSANVAAVKMDGNNVLGARSNSFDEPLTPTNFNIKTINSKGVFVDRTEQRLYELFYDIDVQDYKSLDLSIFAPDFNEVGIVQIAVQMKPDVRVHCIRSDGTAGVLVYDRLENVICWITVTSQGATGLIEDVSVLPGVVEDQVYYIVKRTINGGTQRHLCKWALESEAIGGQLSKIADSFAVYDSTATTAPFTTELLHLRDEVVEVWADGKDVGPLTVSASGGLTLTTAASKVVAGLGYTAQFKSVKLGSLDGIGMLERKKVNRIGFLARHLHHLGLQYGPDFDNLSDLPQVEEGEVVAADTVHTDYHEDDFPFGGEWDPDSRICLQSKAPRPCTMLAALADMESVEKTTRSQ